MLAGGSFYPYSCNPEDVWESVKKEQENLFFIDVQVRGHYPSYAKKLFREKGICLNMEPEDSDILKNTVDFMSFSIQPTLFSGSVSWAAFVTRALATSIW